MAAGINKTFNRTLALKERATSDPCAKGKISELYRKLVQVSTESSNYKITSSVSALTPLFPPHLPNTNSLPHIVP